LADIRLRKKQQIEHTSNSPSVRIKQTIFE
jgi:hypothetical protein